MNAADKLADMLELDQIAFDGLSPVSFSIGKGECVGLSGDSGCGKSRLLRVIADMDEHAGEARLDSVTADDVEAPVWRRQVALLPAESQWWLDAVGEHFPLQEIDYTALGFTDAVADWEVIRCSSGERQRLSILRTLANHPRVLLLDEPTANLDPDNTIRVEALIKDYLARHDACCIWVSHNILQLQRVADRCFEIADGVLSKVGV